MSMRLVWAREEGKLDSSPFGPNSPAVGRLLARARALTHEEIRQLDVVGDENLELRLVAWDHLRDRLRAKPYRTWRFAARRATWQTIRGAARRAGIAIDADDGYWRVDPRPGYGAARAVRFAACALVAPELLSAADMDALLGPWRAIIGEPGPMDA